MSGRPSRHRRTRRQLQLPTQLPWFTEGEGNRLSAPDESAIASDSEDTSGSSTLSEETRKKMEQIKQKADEARKKVEQEEQRRKKAKTNHGFNVWDNQPDESKGCFYQKGLSTNLMLYGREVYANVKFFCVGDYTENKRDQYVCERTKLGAATTFEEFQRLREEIKGLDLKFKSLGTCPVCMEEFSFDDDWKWPCILLKNDEHTLKVEKSNYLHPKYDSDTCEPIDISVAQTCRHNLCRLCARKLVNDNETYYDIESVRVLPVSTTEANVSVSKLPTCPTCRKPFIGYADMGTFNASDLEAYAQASYIRFVREINWTNMNTKHEARVSYWPRILDPVLDRQQRKMIKDRYTILTPSVRKDHLLESGNREEDEAVKKAMNMLRGFVAYEISEDKKFKQQEHELPKGFLSLINGAIDFMITQKTIRDDLFVKQKEEYVALNKKEFYSFLNIFNNISRNFREYYGIPYENILSKTYTFIQDMIEKDRVPISIEEEEEDMNGGSGAKGYTSDDDPNVMLV